MAKLLRSTQARFHSDVQLKPGDIVKHAEAPCEVLCVFPHLSIIFMINKRTLCASFVHPNEVEFVRRPDLERRRK